LSFNALLKYLKEKYNVEPSEIKQVRLTSELIVQTSKGEIKLPLAEVSDKILPSCRKCTDFTSELADISVGGAYPLKDWSTVIIRTKAGEDFFYKAVENRVINTWVIEEEPEVIENVMVAAMEKRKAGLKEAKEMEAATGYLSVLLRESSSLSGVKISEIMTKNVKTVTESMTVQEFLRLVARQHHIGYPLVNVNGEPVGWVTLEEATDVDKDKRSETSVGQIARRNLVSVFPDETALDAFKKMSEHATGRIVVFDRLDQKKVVGIVTKTDLMCALTKQ
jgi:CBS domain-containing protein